MTQTLVGLHYKLEAYVCGAGCVRPSPFEGWATFTLIFQHRPNNCRFAIARMVPLVQKGNFDITTSVAPTGPWLCWDLFDDRLLAVNMSHALDGLLTAPYPKWQGDSADALIMKAMALYDRE